jgi:hypothetical protein
MKYAIIFAATAAASDAYGNYGAYSSPAKATSTPVASSYGGYGYQSSASSKTSSHVSEATPCSTSVGSNGYTTVIPGYGKPPMTVTAQHQAYPTCVAVGYDGKSCEKWGDDKYVSTTLTDYNKNVVTVTKAQECVTVYQEKKTITHYATPTAGGYGAVSTPAAKNATGTWYELYEKVYVIEYENMGKNALPGYPGSGLCHKCDDEQPLTIKEYKGGKWTEEKKTFSYGAPKDDVKVYEKPGVYTIPAKDVTVYKSTPAGKAPEPVVYHYDEKVVTITKANEPYTCTYEAPKQTPAASKTPSKGEEYPATVTKTPTHDDYGYKASATPKKPENEYPSYPSYPGKSNSTSSAAYYAEKSSSMPVYGASSVPVYGASSVPVYSASSVPVYDNGYGAKSTPTPASSSKPVYGDNGYGAKSTPTPPAYGNGYGGDYKPSSSVPEKASSTPCESDKKTATPTPVEYKPSTPSAPAYENNKPSAPVYEANKPSPTPAKPEYESTPYKPSAPVYEANKPSAPVYEASKPSPTPAMPAYENNNNAYGAGNKPSPTPAAPVYPAASPAYPAAGGSNAGAYGNTYAKRSSMIERRKVVV